MARGQRGQLDAPAGEERVRADKEGVGPLAHKRCVGSIDLLTGTGVVKLSLQPEDASSRFKVAARGLRPPNVGRIDKYGDPRGSGHQLKQESQPLCHHFSGEKIDPRRVAARPGEAGDKTQLHWVFGDAKTIGIVGVAAFAASAAGASTGPAITTHLTADQIGRQLRQPIKLAFSPAIFDRHVLALDVACFVRPRRNAVSTVP